MELARAQAQDAETAAWQLLVLCAGVGVVRAGRFEGGWGDREVVGVAVLFKEPLLSESGEGAGDCFPGAADHLGEQFMR